MHSIEPHYSWRSHYRVEEDVNSPFYGKEYSEFEFTESLYDHLIHPQWDNIGSPSLFIKIIYADYKEGYAVIELLGEWNDCLHNDIMFLKRDIADHLMDRGVNKFILIGENVLNFHYSDDCYYEEWFEDVVEENGWIALLNFNEFVLREFSEIDIDSYFVLGGKLNELNWRTKKPKVLFKRISDLVERRFLTA
jgi:hypothetical protein